MILVQKGYIVLIGTEKVGAPESVAARPTARFIFDIHEARDDVQRGDLGLTQCGS